MHELTRLQALGFGLTIAVLSGLVGLMIWGMRARDTLEVLTDRTARAWARILPRTYQPAKTHTWIENVSARPSCSMRAAGAALSSVWCCAWPLIY